MRKQLHSNEPYTHVVLFANRGGPCYFSGTILTTSKLDEALRFSEAAAWRVASKHHGAIVRSYADEKARPTAPAEQTAHQILHRDLRSLSILIALLLLGACSDGAPTAPAPFRPIPAARPPKIDTTAVQVQP